MSSWTLGVAVAVNPMMGMLSPMRCIMDFRLRYSGLKSCPHSEMQCASSMARKLMGTVRKKAT